MKKYLLASVAIVFSTGFAAAQILQPGHGSLIGPDGLEWSIDPYGNILDGGVPVPGGGGTAALTVIEGVVLGKDDGRGPINPGGWFNLSGADWLPVPAPNNLPVTTGGPGSTPPAAALTTGGDGSLPAAAPVTSCAALPGGTSGKGFHVQGGQIIAPDGSVFIAKGINVQTGADLPDAAKLKAYFPGLNFVRLAVYDYRAAAPSAISSYVNNLTSNGIVVELEDHQSSDGSNIGGGSGSAFTGNRLATENSWYAAVASAFKNNPGVWFGTNNEPPSGGLSAWEVSNYAAIRSTGNTNPIMLEKWGGGVPGRMNEGLNPGDFANMTDTIWDVHFYGWALKMSSVGAAVAEAQQIKSANGVMPVIIGEYGITTSGTGTDDNAQQVLQAVQSSGFGSAAWVWDYGAANALTNGGSGLTGYGQTINGYIRLVANAPASIWAAGCNPTAGTQ